MLNVMSAAAFQASGIISNFSNKPFIFKKLSIISGFFSRVYPSIGKKTGEINALHLFILVCKKFLKYLFTKNKYMYIFFILNLKTGKKMVDQAVRERTYQSQMQHIERIRAAKGLPGAKILKPVLRKTQSAPAETALGQSNMPVQGSSPTSSKVAEMEKALQDGSAAASILKEAANRGGANMKEVSEALVETNTSAALLLKLAGAFGDVLNNR